MYFKAIEQSLYGFTKHMPWPRGDIIGVGGSQAANITEELANPEKVQLKPRAEAHRLPAMTLSFSCSFAGSEEPRTSMSR